MNPLFRSILSIFLAIAFAAIFSWALARGQSPTEHPNDPPTVSASAPSRPIWRDDVRANTDASGLAQQEPHLAISRRDPNVIVVAAKDFRETDNISRSVWIYTYTTAV